MIALAQMVREIATDQSPVELAVTRERTGLRVRVRSERHAGVFAATPNEAVLALAQVLGVQALTAERRPLRQVSRWARVTGDVAEVDRCAVCREQPFWRGICAYHLTTTRPAALAARCGTNTRRVYFMRRAACGQCSLCQRPLYHALLCAEHYAVRWRRTRRVRPAEPLVMAEATHA